MKIVLRTLVFHIICIIIFAFLYKYLAVHFGHDINKNNNKMNANSSEMIDYFLLSVTIQASIGFSKMYPVSHVSKLVLMIHQLIVISTHVFTLYIFTI